MIKDLQFLTRLTRPLLINGVQITPERVEELIIEGHTSFNVTLQGNQDSPTTAAEKAVVSATTYKIKVRPYMTKPSTPDFNFHDKFNNGIPMPFRIMVGEVLETTPKMVKMKLRAELTADKESTCMKCGRTISNPTSIYFGLGPECGGHAYTNPFNSQEELLQAIDYHKKQLLKITWEGWIPKSAIMEREEVVYAV